jgi:hypothetical protein
VRHDLEYKVIPGHNVPQGLPRLRLAVLSAVWRGAALRLEYPDGEVQTLVGWSGPGEGGPCELRVFWTQPGPEGPAVALADSLIPPAVRQVIGPPPPPEPQPTLLLG